MMSSEKPGSVPGWQLFCAVKNRITSFIILYLKKRCNKFRGTGKPAGKHACAGTHWGAGARDGRQPCRMMRQTLHGLRGKMGGRKNGQRISFEKQSNMQFLPVFKAKTGDIFLMIAFFYQNGRKVLVNPSGGYAIMEKQKSKEKFHPSRTVSIQPHNVRGPGHVILHILIGEP